VCNQTGIIAESRICTCYKCSKLTQIFVHLIPGSINYISCFWTDEIGIIFRITLKSNPVNLKLNCLRFLKPRSLWDGIGLSFLIRGFSNCLLLSFLKRC
jgi:hypothetical protein